MEPKPTNQLPLMLSNHIIRLFSYSFGKIVLFAEQQQQGLKHEIKHYDIQCEGANLLQGVLKKITQNNKLKAFHSIKQMMNRQNKYYSVKQKGWVPVSSNHLANRDPRLMSYTRIQTSIRSFENPNNLSSQYRSRQNQYSGPNSRINGEVSNYGESLSLIMSRMRAVNTPNLSSPRFSMRQGFQFANSTKDMKRALILDKLRYLQGQLVNIANRQQALSHYNIISKSRLDLQNSKIPSGPL